MTTVKMRCGTIVADTGRYWIKSYGGFMSPSLLYVTDTTLEEVKTLAEELFENFDMDSVRVFMAGYLVPPEHIFDGKEWTVYDTPYGQ